MCLVFTVCQTSRHMANKGFAVCPTLCHVLPLWHTANDAFAVCPIYGVRQSLWHTAILPFPVVIETNKIKLQRVLAQIMPAIRFASR